MFNFRRDIATIYHTGISYLATPKRAGIADSQRVLKLARSHAHTLRIAKGVKFMKIDRAG